MLKVKRYPKYQRAWNYAK